MIAYISITQMLLRGNLQGQRVKNIFLYIKEICLFITCLPDCVGNKHSENLRAIIFLFFFTVVHKQ